MGETAFMPTLRTILVSALLGLALLAWQTSREVPATDFPESPSGPGIDPPTLVALARAETTADARTPRQKPEEVTDGEHEVTPAEDPAPQGSEREAWAKKYEPWTHAMRRAQIEVLQGDLGEEVSRRIMDPDSTLDVIDLGSSGTRVNGTDALEGRLGAIALSDGRARARALPELAHPDLYALRREVEWLREGVARGQ